MKAQCRRPQWRTLTRSRRWCGIARGRWQVLEFLQGAGGAGGQNIARYRDGYVRCPDGRWRFERRELFVTFFGPADLNDPKRG